MGTLLTITGTRKPATNVHRGGLFGIHIQHNWIIKAPRITGRLIRAEMDNIFILISKERYNKFKK